MPSSPASRWGCRSCPSVTPPRGWPPPSASSQRSSSSRPWPSVPGVPGRCCVVPTCSGPCCSAGPWAAWCSPSRPPSRPPRSSVRSGSRCCPWPRSSPCCMPCTTAAPASPLVPRGLVRGRLVWALVVSLLVGVALVAVVVDVPLLARIVQGSSQTGAALVLVRFLVAVPVGALAGGWALRRFGNGVVAAAGLALAAVGLAADDARGAGARSTTCRRRWCWRSPASASGWPWPRSTTPRWRRRPSDTHGTASALVVVARMVGMVVGLALLTAIGLHQYYGVVATLPDPTDTEALKGAAVLQVAWVFRGAAVAAGARGARLAGPRAAPPHRRARDHLRALEAGLAPTFRGCPRVPEGPPSRRDAAVLIRRPTPCRGDAARSPRGRRARQRPRVGTPASAGCGRRSRSRACRRRRR